MIYDSLTLKFLIRTKLLVIVIVRRVLIRFKAVKKKIKTLHGVWLLLCLCPTYIAMQCGKVTHKVIDKSSSIKMGSRVGI